MKILVTGGSGFIGTRLVGDLVSQGHAVMIYDKRAGETYPCTVADVRDAATLKQASRGVDAVFHLAAEHHDNVQPASLYDEVNVGGAQNLAGAAEENGITTIIFTSSVALYGLNVGIPDETFPMKPFNAYGRSKLLAEQVLQEWASKQAGRTLIIVRPVVIFGENNRGNVYNLLCQLASGRFVMVGTGRNRKSMGYVRNISRFLVHMLTRGPGVEIYNYADQPDMTARELVDAAREALGRNGPLLRVPYPVGLLGGYLFDALSIITRQTYPISSIRVKKFCASTQVASRKLRETGFVAPFTLEQGLRRMIEFEFKGARLVQQPQAHGVA